MNKGLTKAALNRAIAKGDTAKIEQYTAELSSFSSTGPVITDDNIRIAIKRLNEILNMRKTIGAYCVFDGVTYTLENINNISSIDLTNTTFWRIGSNHANYQIIY